MDQEYRELRDSFLEGFDLPSSEVLELETLRDYLSLKDRVKLLGYYNAKRSYSPHKERRQELVLWLIENCASSSFLAWGHADPDCDDQVFFDKVKQSWQKQIQLHSNDPRVIANAANQIGFCDQHSAQIILSDGLKRFPDSAALNKILRRFDLLDSVIRSESE